MTLTKKPRRMARPPQAGEGGSIHADAMAQTGVMSDISAEKRVTKQSLVLELLYQEGGASLAAIVQATSWLPHTARAALTGLRKKGHAIERSSVEGESRYTITPTAAE